MLKRTLINIAAVLLFASAASAQEVIIGLQSDLRQKNNDPGFSKSATADTLSLPFFDDFSKGAGTPDEKKWSDSYVLINNSYSDRQITTGIATFDIIDNSGHLYETMSPTGFEADHLTSQPINLNYPASDNIWLTFFYQPGGLGDMPEENDSLTLHFYSPSDKKWYSVWRAAGNKTPVFKAAAVKIDKAKFLVKGFRFRFVNYASSSPNLVDPSMIGNCDQWNLDYVVLDRNRNAADTIFRDVAIRYPSRSLLKNHEAMPWKQFRQIYLQEMGSSIPVHYRNNDTIVRNVTRDFEIRDVYRNTTVRTFTAGATNIDPLTNVDYNASLIYTFNSDLTDSALFRIKSWLITDDFDPKQNDTTVYYQHFGNYFAFDDGTAEAGYGINGLGSRNAMVALRFRSYIQDTLRAISICFNDSYLNANQRLIDLMVWSDLDGMPGDPVYIQEEMLARPGNSTNGFHTYTLSKGVPVSGIFYIGWKQRSETFLNAGLDMNTLPGGRQYYYLNGSWNQSQIAGTLMIRPVVGLPLTTGIRKISAIKFRDLHFWPNPASESIYLESDEFAGTGTIYITITDMNGRQLIKVPFTDRIDVSQLKAGLYIIKASRNNITLGTGRLIKKY